MLLPISWSRYDVAATGGGLAILFGMVGLVLTLSFWSIFTGSGTGCIPSLCPAIELTPNNLAAILVGLVVSVAMMSLGILLFTLARLTAK